MRACQFPPVCSHAAQAIMGWSTSLFEVGFQMKASAFGAAEAGEGDLVGGWDGRPVVEQVAADVTPQVLWAPNCAPVHARHPGGDPH